MTDLPLFDQREFPPDIRAVLARLTQMPANERTAAALKAAAPLLEFAAYELARSEQAKQVARLILMAADMERTAASLAQQA
ncbi:MAG: hypothetical protein AAGM84_03450 [Pseudomonadota bacterium]